MTKLVQKYFLGALLIFNAINLVLALMKSGIGLQLPDSAENWFLTIIGFILWLALYPALIFFAPTQEEQNVNGAIVIKWFAMNSKTRIVLFAMIMAMTLPIALLFRYHPGLFFFVFVIMFVIIWTFNWFTWLIKTDDSAGVLVKENDFRNEIKNALKLGALDALSLVGHVSSKLGNKPNVEKWSGGFKDMDNGELQLTVDLDVVDKFQNSKKSFPKIGAVVFGGEPVMKNDNKKGNRDA